MFTPRLKKTGFVLETFRKAGTRQVVDLIEKIGVFFGLFLVFGNYTTFQATPYIVPPFC